MTEPIGKPFKITQQTDGYPGHPEPKASWYPKAGQHCYPHFPLNHERHPQARKRHRILKVNEGKYLRTVTMTIVQVEP